MTLDVARATMSSRAVTGDARGMTRRARGRRRGTTTTRRVTTPRAMAFDASKMMKLADATTVVLVNDGHADARDSHLAGGVRHLTAARGKLQYVGLSRRVNASVKVHAFEMPQYCHAVRCVGMEGASKADLQTAWKTWVMEHVAAEGGLPPGTRRGTRCLASGERGRARRACV